MKEIFAILVLPTLTAAIWWLLMRWVDADRARADQRAWQYLAWEDAALEEHHKQYVDMLARNERRAMCLRQIDAIKAAIEMRHKLRSEWQREQRNG